jgi:hypothetical protein
MEAKKEPTVNRTSGILDYKRGEAKTLKDEPLPSKKE